MPISPENKKLYPKNWPIIRQRILYASDHKCEFCGLRNHIIGYRDDNRNFVECNGNPGEIINTSEGDKKIMKVVLTIAHLDHDPTNNHRSNLKALCQQCHNRHDAKHRAISRQQRKKGR